MKEKFINRLHSEFILTDEDIIEIEELTNSMEYANKINESHLAKEYSNQIKKYILKLNRK